MGLQTVLALFSVLGFVAEVALFVVLLVRRQYKVFPIFTLYIAFNVLYDVGIGSVAVAYSPHVGRLMALGLMPLEYLLELGVLLEIAWNVLRPVHLSLPKGSLRVFSASVTLALLCGTLLAWHLDNTGNKVQDYKGPLDLTFGLLRMLVFVAWQLPSPFIARWI
jgi:hypothetical protein